MKQWVYLNGMLIYDIPITGVGEKETCRITKRTQFKFSPFFTNAISVDINAYIMPKITTLPISPPDLNEWNHLHRLQLADPKLDRSGRVDVLLGNGTVTELLLTGLIKGDPNQPIAQKTSLGWVISGKIGLESSSSLPVCTVIMSDQSLSSVLQRFWESEEIPRINKLTPDEQLAEDIYQRTTKRCDDGRFMVKLPFKTNPVESLGESLKIAKRRYQYLQKRFDKNPEFREKYNQCIEEY